MYPAAAVADALLEKAWAEGRTLNHMQLQKLVYMAHGWHLAVTTEPLIEDTVEAWTFGPIIPTLYDDLKRYGTDPVPKPVAWWDGRAGQFSARAPEFPEATADVINRVWEGYKNMSDLQLSTLAHRKGTPWYDLLGELPERKRREVPIPDGNIRDYYVHLAHSRR